MSELPNHAAGFFGTVAKSLVMKDGECEQHGRNSVLSRPGDAWKCRYCLEAELAVDTHARWMQDRCASLMDSGRIPSKYIDAQFKVLTNEQRIVKKTVLRFRDFVMRENSWAALVLAGRTGTGKTLLACELAQAIIKATRSVRYITAKGMISEIQASYGREGKSEEGEIMRFAQYDFLILDEVDALADRENSKLLLTEVINRRYNENKPVIVISNQELAKLADFVGDRVHSRLYENLFSCDFSWDDYRRAGVGHEAGRSI